MTAFLRDRQFWGQLGWGVLTALLAGLGTLVFVILMNLGLSLVWSWLEPADMQPFSGPWQIAAIMTVAGVIVGVIRHYTNAKEVNVFAAVAKGRLDPRPVPSSLLVSLASLVGGFSLGPEVPSGMLAGGLGTWLSERRKMSDEFRKSNVISGVVSAYGGLFTSPFAFVLMLLELVHRQTPAYFAVLTIAAVAATIGFAIFFGAAGNEFAELLHILDLPTYSLELWHVLVTVPLTVLGAVVAIIYGLLTLVLTRLAAPLEKQPILRGGLGGLLLGLLGMALPLTLFLGSESLVFVTENGAQLGAALIVVLALGKILATSGALSMGFIGGPIFPLFFVGGAIGTAVNLAFPTLPLALTVGSIMAAVTGALLPAPLTIAVIVLLVTGLNAAEAIPVILAALLGHAIVHGLGLIPGPAPAEKAGSPADENAGAQPADTLD